MEEKNAKWNTPFLFTSKELDRETGMNYFGARYQDPKLGIFISVDPLAEKFAGRSPYEYCFNNPVNFIDPDGMWPWPSWNSIKQFAKGFTNSAVSMGVHNLVPAVGVYNGAKTAWSIGKDVINGNYGSAKNKTYNATGIPGAINTVKRASKGDAEAIGNLAVVAVSAIATKGSIAATESSIAKGVATAASAEGGISKSIFTEAGKVESLAESNNIKSMQSGLRSEKVVGEILDKMKSPEGFDASKYSIGGYYSEGIYYINEGNHRMASGLQYQLETGSSFYVDKLLETGSWTNKAPTGKTIILQLIQIKGMNKYKLKKNEVYKINLPSDFEIINVVKNIFDFSNFKNISIPLSSFSFDAEKFDSFILREYIEDYAVDKSFLYFYEEYKDLPIRQLSIKKKIILDIITVINEYDCFIFSMEALSTSTQTDLFFLFHYLNSCKYGKTFICFDYSKLNCKYRKIEVNIVTPSWQENLLEEFDFNE